MHRDLDIEETWNMENSKYGSISEQAACNIFVAKQATEYPKILVLLTALNLVSSLDQAYNGSVPSTE